MPDVNRCPYSLCVETDVHGHGTDCMYLPRVQEVARNVYRSADEAVPCPHGLDCHEGGLHRHGTDALYAPASSLADLDPQGPTFTEEIDEALGREPTKQREGDQALPRPGVTCVQDLVIERMEESKRVGVERYGSTLQTFNGRKGIQDVAEEVRDLFVYLTQIEEEAKADRETLVEVVMGVFRRQFADRSQGAPFEVHEREMREDAEGAVDAVMGWVVGRLNHVLTDEETIEVIKKAMYDPGDYGSGITAHGVARRIHGAVREAQGL